MVSVQPGEMVAEKYRVERVIGRGGMGVVVQAEHVHLGQRVAIKFLLLESGQKNDEAVARFQREGRSAVKLHSEHVAKVFDVGALPDGTPFMVIEFLEGNDLAEELASRGPLPVAEAVGWILEACDAIAEAHSIGIVHRDLKPANLFLARRPNRPSIVKVLDFGISKNTSVVQATSALTGASALMGSPLYMSPEQLRSTRDVDARADIWALGVTLYELLAGVTPFNAEFLPELFSSIFTAEPRRIERADVPAALVSVILRCLAKDANARFQSVGGLTEALLPFATWSRGATRVVANPSALRPDVAPVDKTRALSSAVGSVPVPLSSNAPAVVVTADALSVSSAGLPPAAKPRGLVIAIVSALLLFAGVSAIAIGMVRKGHSDAPTAQAAMSAPLTADAPSTVHSVSTPPTAPAIAADGEDAGATLPIAPTNTGVARPPVTPLRQSPPSKALAATTPEPPIGNTHVLPAPRATSSTSAKPRNPLDIGLQ